MLYQFYEYRLQYYRNEATDTESAFKLLDSVNFYGTDLF